jgi:hypothetical protein
MVELVLALAGFPRPVLAISDHGRAHFLPVLRPGKVPAPTFLNQGFEDGWGLDVDQVQHQDAEVHDGAGGADVVLGEGGFNLALVDHVGGTRSGLAGFRPGGGGDR